MGRPKGSKNKYHKLRPDPVLCGDGCGQYAKPGKKYISGHNKSMLGKKFSVESRLKMSDSQIKREHKTGQKQTEEHKRNRAESYCGFKHTEETKNKMSKSRKGRIVWNKGLTIEDPRVARSVAGLNTSEARAKIRNTLTGRKMSNAIKEKQRIVAKQKWQDPVFAQFMSESWKKKINNLEKQFLDILDELCPDYFQYVGDGHTFITGKNPDFINFQNKLIIELFGCYWHGCPAHYPVGKHVDNSLEIINHFSQYGYQTLIIWEHELKDAQVTIQKITEFISVSDLRN